ncbi:Crp/Fnr family transcriptional regulator [Rubidibacter lacunae]|uniref:Crp/Fnr family transcriptional regulator n=1 Tax=Rubidibacter lacunae TaxID=582514 RepID=UPI000403E8C0|nr:Crp/Fnr family transcriptional regulator [Rubidibacter lacunae]
MTWQRILDWAQTHYRERTFTKDERIPARPGLLYLLHRGAVRLVGSARESAASPASLPDGNEETFLGFVGAGQPFEIVAQSPFTLQAFAHVEQTSVVWMYWHDLDNWPHFRWEILDAFRRQHQRKLIWLSTLGQRQTIDRLLGFITLLVEEHGEPSEGGYYLPFPLTHAQIGSAIGSTRVTVTRLMGKLRQRGEISIVGDNLICLPTPNGQLRSSVAELQLLSEDDPDDDADLADLDSDADVDRDVDS